VEHDGRHGIEPGSDEVDLGGNDVPRERRNRRATPRTSRGRSIGRIEKPWRSFDQYDITVRKLDFRLSRDQKSRRILSKRAQGQERRRLHETVMAQAGRRRPRRSRFTLTREAKAMAGVSNQNDTRRPDEKLCSPGQRYKRTHTRW
jgi:hypothetical protein